MNLNNISIGVAAVAIASGMIEFYDGAVEFVGTCVLTGCIGYLISKLDTYEAAQ